MVVVVSAVVCAADVFVGVVDVIFSWLLLMVGAAFVVFVFSCFVGVVDWLTCLLLLPLLLLLILLVVVVFFLVSLLS